MKSIKIPILLFALSLLVISCHKDPPKTYDDQDMTVSYYNTEFNFKEYDTFIIPDSTVLRTNYLTDGQIKNFYASDGVSEKVLDLTVQMFEDLGYVNVDSLQDADFIALPTIIMMQTDETIWYSPGWWWGYPGYGWGIGIGIGFKSTEYYYYPDYYWYPPGVPVTISSNNGTLSCEMIDAESYRIVAEYNENNPEPGDEGPQLVVNWTAMIEGSVTDDGDYNKERAVRGMNEAIAQSPYLKK